MSTFENAEHSHNTARFRRHDPPLIERTVEHEVGGYEYGATRVEITADEIELPNRVRQALIPAVGYNAAQTITLEGLFDLVVDWGLG